MKLIQLSNGDYASVDDEHYQELSQYKWHAKQGRRTVYAIRWFGSKGKAWMHREIMRMVGKDNPKQTDHIDGNGLNNQASNLRPATATENQRNQRVRCDNKSGFKGVDYIAKRQLWRARIRVNGQQKTIGEYRSIEAAARAYDNAAANLFGDFAKTNAMLAGVA